MSKDNKIYVFLSHSHLDYEKVRIVRNLLEQEGYRPLMFFLKCLENEEYKEVTKTLIKKEIDSRQRFILCSSENAKKSDWVKFEIDHIVKTNRPYEIIELDDTVANQIDAVKNFKRRSSVFMSYPIRLNELAQVTAHTLEEKDFLLSEIKYDLSSGMDIMKQLDSASKQGYILIFIDENIKVNSAQYLEIEHAIKINERNHTNCIIPVWASQKFDYYELLDSNPTVFGQFADSIGINVCKMGIKLSASTIANRLFEIDIQQNNRKIDRYYMY